MWAELTFMITLISAGLGHPSLIGGTTDKGYDGFPSNLNERLGRYVPPGPTDSRGPCPGLNTLANHGLINRNGKNIRSQDIPPAFARGFGLAADGLVTVLHNFEVVCEYVNGVPCISDADNGSFILTNLTLLGEPHAFEHDHSYSRQDYKQGYAGGQATDNIYFNSTEFQTSLDVVGYHPSNPPRVQLANYQEFNQIRLQRESIQNSADFPGWFQQSIPATLFETGFIFGATFDRFPNGSMKGSTPLVRLDWWNFWFSEESFPTQLGWAPASTEVFNFHFLTSVSKTVLQQSITSTPSNLPTSATDSTAAALPSLPDVDPSPTYTLFQSAPYAAPTAPSHIHSDTCRCGCGVKPPSVGASISLLLSLAPRSIVNRATSVAGPRPTAFDWYRQKLDVRSVKEQVAAAQSYESAVRSAVIQNM